MITAPFLFSCSGDDITDSKKTVELTVYPDTGYNGFLFSDDVFGEFLQFSEGKHPTKRLLLSAGDSFQQFDYQKGYKYVIKATKIKLKYPPQDGSDTLYAYLETLSKIKVVKGNLATEIFMEIAPVKVNYIPWRGELKEALLVKVDDEIHPRPIPKIQDFEFEKGFTYRLKVKKEILAEPYQENYTLIDIISKNQ